MPVAGKDWLPLNLRLSEVIMLEWNIQSRAHTCHRTGHAFTQGERYHTVLIEGRQGFERLDLSAAAWREHGTEISTKPGFVSHWVGTYQAPAAAPPEAIRRDDAESLLRALLARGDARHAGAVYILAVMLERKRLLKVKAQTRESGRRITLYEQPKTGDVFAVADPELQLSQLEAVQRDVASLLEHGLPALEVEAAAPPLSGAPEEEPFNAPSELTTLAPA
jgi:hypothetical protein